MSSHFSMKKPAQNFKSISANVFIFFEKYQTPLKLLYWVRLKRSLKYQILTLGSVLTLGSLVKWSHWICQATLLAFVGFLLLRWKIKNTSVKNPNKRWHQSGCPGLGNGLIFFPLIDWLPLCWKTKKGVFTQWGMWERVRIFPKVLRTWDCF